MKTSLLVYAITLVLLLIIDAAWIFLFMSKLYQKYLSHLMASSMSLWPAAIFYLLYAFGLCFFVVYQAIDQDKSLWSTFASGLLLGLIAYAAYDLTNQATLKDWPVLISIIDIAWGGLLSGIVACLATWIARLLLRP